MSRIKITSMTACLCIATLSVAFAQSDSTPRRGSELALFAGLSRSEHLDVTASPLRFSGGGLDVTADYIRSLGETPLVFALAFNGGARNYKNATSAAAERLGEGELRGALLRRLSGNSAGSELAVGIAVTADVAVTEHQYADPSQRKATFLVGFCTLGPAVAWRSSIKGGVALVQLTTPIASLVDHPYSETRGDYTPTSIRVASLGTFRGLNGSITYAPAERRRVGVIAGYRFAVLDYADVQPFRSASQALSIGVVTRFGVVRR